MDETPPRIDRRDFLRTGGASFFGAALFASSTTESAAAGPADEGAPQSGAPIRAQSISAPDGELTTSDILIETLIEWGATHVFGIVGDGVAGIIEAIRKRQDRIRYIGVRQ
jgi:pyruvate dehydrogenase (quinone)/pyruvate decarboxylase